MCGEGKGVKKNKKLFIILKIEYGAGEENVYTEILNASSSRSTAMAIKERYMEEYAELFFFYPLLSIPLPHKH